GTPLHSPGGRRRAGFAQQALEACSEDIRLPPADADPRFHGGGGPGGDDTSGGTAEPAGFLLRASICGHHRIGAATVLPAAAGYPADVRPLPDDDAIRAFGCGAMA